MIRDAEREKLQAKLLDWFAVFQRDLPWRRTRDPYAIWVSEIMLQQTRVAAAIPYYERFLTHFPDVKALAEAPEAEVLRLWAGLGYYSRARNLQKAAREIAARHGGRFPESEAEALELAGIGTYTAAAILSIAYGKRLAVLDGNVARVLARLDAVHGDLRANGRWQELQKRADELLAGESPGDWNQALMELGATMCTPKSPQCLLCPVGEFCEARKRGLTEEIPEKRKKRGVVELTLAVAVMVNRAGKALVLPPPKRKASTGDAGDVAALVSRMWHFPTIEVKKDAEAELRKYLEKRLLGGKRLAGKLVEAGKARHAVTYRAIKLKVFRVDVERLPKVAGAKALRVDELGSVAISNLTRKAAAAARD